MAATASLRRRALFALATSGAFEQAALASDAGRRAAWRVGARYVAGSSVDDALRVAADLRGRGVAASLDLFGERERDAERADRVADAYAALAGRLGAAPAGTWLSVDLSHLAVQVDAARAQRRLAAIVDALPDGARLQVGAEEAALTDRVLDATIAVGAPGRLCVTLQANLRRSERDLERLAAEGLMVRLVKGAYVEPPRVAHAYGQPTDAAYVRLAGRAAELGADVALATHDDRVREACRAVLPGAPVEMLLGVRPGTQAALAAAGVPVRTYVPYGDGWFWYAMRRVAEAQGA